MSVRSSAAARELLCSLPQRCTSRRPRVVRLVLLLITIIIISSLCSTATASSASATASAAASQYESVRALDQYGNAVQLENARAAADQQGRLVIGIRRPAGRRRRRRQNASATGRKAKNTPCSFWILSTSLSRSQSPHLRVTARSSLPVVGGDDGSSGSAAAAAAATAAAAVGTSSTGIVHWLWSPPPAYDPSSTSNSGSGSGSGSTTSCMVCTGVQADAVWLVGQMQSYQKNRWERYNNNRADSLATAVADCMRLFWGHSARNMWHGAAWKSVMDDNDNSDDSWARPLGVRALVLQGSEWYLVEPSGVVQRCDDRVCCMGPNSPAIQAKLLEAFDKQEQEKREQQLLGNGGGGGGDGDGADGIDLDDDAEDALLQELVTGVLTSVLGTKPEHVLLEVVSSRGVERRTIAL
jgi:hypothetical protein